MCASWPFQGFANPLTPQQDTKIRHAGVFALVKELSGIGGTCFTAFSLGGQVIRHVGNMLTCLSTLLTGHLRPTMAVSGGVRLGSAVSITSNTGSLLAESGRPPKILRLDCLMPTARRYLAVESPSAVEFLISAGDVGRPAGRSH
jgi:hypothetical protein